MFLYYPEKYPAFIQKNAQQFKGVLFLQTRCLFFCSFSSSFDFPRVKKKKELSVFCPCQSQQSTCMSLILYSSRDVTTCLRSSCQKMFVECEKEFPTARCTRRIHQSDIKVEEYKQDLWIHFMCLCLCSRTWRKISVPVCTYSCSCVHVCLCVTLLPACTGPPQHYWVPVKLHQLQTACWSPAEEQRSSARWAWAPRTPSAASLGYSSPPSPAARVHCLQNEKQTY